MDKGKYEERGQIRSSRIALIQDQGQRDIPRHVDSALTYEVKKTSNVVICVPIYSRFYVCCFYDVIFQRKHISGLSTRLT